MKKLIALLVCLHFIAMPTYGVITDEFAENPPDKNIKPLKPQRIKITDDFVEETLNKNADIKIKKRAEITDDFAQNNKNKNVKSNNTVYIEETLPEKTAGGIKKKVVTVDKSNMTSVRVKIKNNYSTKSRKQIQEGDYIEFVTVDEVNVNKKVYPAGTEVLARVETISMNQNMGVPADLVVGNFNIDNNLLSGEINKTGANRSLWVYPAMCLTVWFYGAGLLFTLVRGGHAKIKKSETFTLYAQN